MEKVQEKHREFMCRRPKFIALRVDGENFIQHAILHTIHADYSQRRRGQNREFGFLNQRITYIKRTHLYCKR